MIHTFLPVYFHWWQLPFIFLAGMVGESFEVLIQATEAKTKDS
jgi:hypothetical protein